MTNQHRRRTGALGALLSAALGASGCATGNPPIRLRVVTPDLTVAPGQEFEVAAVVENISKLDLRLETGASVTYSLMCRGPGDPPGEWGFGTAGGLEGGVWGGVTHRQPPPDDPLFCREYPPASFVLAPGGTRPYEVRIETPSRCAEGEAELGISFGAPHHGRKCPGIWYGETAKIQHRVRIRRPGEGQPVMGAPSPKVLECALGAPAASSGEGEPALQLTLRNPTARSWKARTIPALELKSLPNWEEQSWAPFALSEPVVPLGANESHWLEIPPHSSVIRAIPLGGLSWGGIGASLWPADALTTLVPGPYEAFFTMEVVGGRSWELRCTRATVELSHPHPRLPSDDAAPR